MICAKFDNTVGFPYRSFNFSHEKRRCCLLNNTNCVYLCHQCFVDGDRNLQKGKFMHVWGGRGSEVKAGRPIAIGSTLRFSLCPSHVSSCPWERHFTHFASSATHTGVQLGVNVMNLGGLQ